MSNIQNSILLLYTSVLPVNGTNSFGTSNSNLTQMTWKNINMRQVLGTNFDKYLKFNLNLMSVIIPQNGNVIPDANCNALIYMSGLAFDQSSTYSTLALNNISASYVGNVRFNAASTSTSSITNYSLLSNNTFLRDGEIVDITINLTAPIPTSGNFSLQFTSPYPQVVYTFHITPVVESLITIYPVNGEQTQIFKQRLFKS
jgi:hypothetical protein